MAIPIERIDEYRWRIPAGTKPGMKVPAIIFADDRLMEQIKGDLSLEQAANAATLPGVVRAAYTMPDIHQGYGLPIGAVVATGQTAASSRRVAWGTTSTAVCGCSGPTSPGLRSSRVSRSW